MKYILMLTFIFCLMSCSSQKKLEVADIPFEVSNSSVQSWSGGRAESGSGADLKLVLAEPLNDVNVEKVYFRARMLDCEVMTENEVHMIVASYKTDKTSEDTADKEGAKMKKVFDIGVNEAVISYRTVDDELKYVKVTSIKEKSPVLYKGRPRD